MRLHESKFVQFLGNLPKTKKIFLLHGTTETKIWYYRKLLEFKLLGKKARLEMRVITLATSLLNKDKTLLLNEMKTRSFFGDEKGIIIENVADKETKLVMEVLENLEEPDPFLIMTSGYLNQSSKLRKAIENDVHSCSVGFYQEGVTEREVQNLLQQYKINHYEPNVIETLRKLSENYDFLEFRQELKKLSLFKCNDEKPLSLKELEDVFSSESNPNEKKLIDHLIERQQQQVIEYFKNHAGNIKNPISVISRATSQFKILHRLLSDKGNELNILKNTWPPIFGKNKDKLIESSKTWKINGVENAIKILRKTDLTLRVNSKISSKALLINSFVDICLLNN